MSSVSPHRAENSSLEHGLGYHFKDELLLQQALTHKSYVNEHSGTCHNERLEFLGDAVLQFLISDMLSQHFPSANEGTLTRMRAVLVSQKGLAEIARQLALGQYLRVGRGEQLAGLAQQDSLLSNTLESLLAATYLDSCQQQGLTAVRQLVQKLFQSHLKNLPDKISRLNYKSRLQELAQKNCQQPLEYTIKEERGPAHNRFFCVSVWIAGREYASGEGHTKQQAEQVAAEKAWCLLTKELSS